MGDRFADRASHLESPATHAAAVTPNDNADLTESCRALWIGTAGTLKVTTVDGDTVEFLNATGWMPIRAKRVFGTVGSGTVAAGIVAVW